jgi:predicted PurR-regulated permease PerM
VSIEDRRQGSRARRLSLGDVARRTAVIFAVLTGGVLVLLLVYDLRVLIVWLLLALMLAVALAPAVAWLERRRWPRWLAASAVTVAAAALAIGVVAAVAIPLVSQSNELFGSIPRLTRTLFADGGPLAGLDRRFHIVNQVRSIQVSQIVHLLSGGGGSVVDVFTRVLSVLAAAVTVMTIALMSLLEGPRIWVAFVDSLGDRGRRVDDVGRLMTASIAGYVRGNLLISLMAGVGSFVAMTILRVPFALPLALAVGILDLVPLIGAILGAGLCVLVALTVGWVPAVVLLVYFVVYQQVENHAILPVVYAKLVALSPLTVLIVSLAGAFLGGLVGVLLAIPLASAGSILVGEIAKSRGVEDLADLAEVISEEGPVPVSEDDAERPEEFAAKHEDKDAADREEHAA